MITSGVQSAGIGRTVRLLKLIDHTDVEHFSLDYVRDVIDGT